MKQREQSIAINDKGFTLLEVMIAIAIFGFLMLYVSQFMKLEIGTYNQAARENDLEQKARIAVMYILDEARINKYTFYQSGLSRDGQDGRGIYRYDPDPQSGNSVSLVDADPPGNSPRAEIYYEKTEVNQGNGKLYYQVPRVGYPSILDKYLIAEGIQAFDIQTVLGVPGLVKIDIKVGLPAGAAGGAYTPQPYELVTWVRLF